MHRPDPLCIHNPFQFLNWLSMLRSIDRNGGISSASSIVSIAVSAEFYVSIFDGYSLLKERIYFTIKCMLNSLRSKKSQCYLVTSVSSTSATVNTIVVLSMAFCAPISCPKTSVMLASKCQTIIILSTSLNHHIYTCTAALRNTLQQCTSRMLSVSVVLVSNWRT